MIELSTGALEWLAVGCLLTLTGALIKFRGWTFLLAGYNDSANIEDRVVQNMAGNSILRIGLALFLVGIFESVATPPSYLSVLVDAAILFELLRLLYRLNTWSPQET